MNKEQKKKIIDFTTKLVDPKKAHVIVEPNGKKAGFWFGGGDLVEFNNALYVTGRYRDFGDSRTGTGAGKRGWELAIFKSEDKGKTFKKVKAFSKKDLSIDWEVLSIEGTALTKTKDGIRLFVSVETSDNSYPAIVKEFQKPGTGKWIIFHMDGKTPEDLEPTNVNLDERVDDDIRYLHPKDPTVYRSKQNTDKLVFCTHPFNWAGTTSAYFDIDSNGNRIGESHYDIAPRGITWDVAVTRTTSMLDLDLGSFKGTNTQLVFYDGAECMRQLDDHKAAVSRHRGWSCEEIASVATTQNANFETFERVELLKPLFTSPWGIGTLRYIHVLETEDGFYATYQCSSENESQPLMLNFVSREEANSILK